MAPSLPRSMGLASPGTLAYYNTPMGINLKLPDPAETAAEIEAFLRAEMEESRRQKAVVALSGGVDSSLVAVLAVRALGPERVISHTLPDGEATSPEDTRDAGELARSLGIACRRISIHPPLEGFKRTFQEVGLHGDQRAWANVKPRLRMIVNYFVANFEDGLVLGTGNKSELLLGYFCYDAQTRVLTPEGPKSYWELYPGTTVFSLDPQTRRVVEVPVEAVHVFPYRGEMIEIRTNRLDLLVTPNHRILVRRNHGKGSVSFRTAESCFRAGSVAIPTPEPWSGCEAAPSEIDTTTFLDEPLAWNAHPPVQMAIDDFLYLLGLFIGDGSLARGHVRAVVKSRLTAEERIADRRPDGRFAPLPQATVQRRVKTYPALRIHIGAAENSRSRPPLLEALRRYDIPITETSTQVVFTNRALAAVFDECGHGAAHKRIPCWVLRWPSSSLRHLFRGLMDSDGNANGSAFTTISEVLAYQMVELCMKLGLHAWVKRRPPRTSCHHGKVIHSREIFEVRISQKARTLTFTPRNMRRVFYEGVVWCPSVPPYENVLIERNGYTAFCGNTKYGDGGVDLLPIGHLYKTQVRQLARFVGVPEPIIEKPPSAGLWKGQTDEEELGISYDEVDKILHCLHDRRMSVSQTVKTLKVRKQVVQRVLDLMKAGEHKRRLPPMPG